MLKISVVATALMLILTTNTHAGEESLYDFLWLDPDKKVYVLQNKLYKKEHSFYADIGYLTNYTSKFQNTQGFGLRAGYYFHEEWAFELFMNQYSNANNDDYRSIRVVNGADPFIRKLNSTYGAMAVWSPFYGKINTFNQIYYFDWSFGAGYAQVNAKSNLKTAALGSAVSKYESDNYTGGVLKTKVKFHVNEHVHLGVEYMNTYYMAPSPKNPKTDKLRTNTDIIFSVGFSY